MTLSTAQLLASQHGFTAFGSPSKATLLSCIPAMYFAAALIDHLSSFGGVRRGLCFTVKAFFAGARFLCCLKYAVVQPDRRDGTLPQWFTGQGSFDSIHGYVWKGGTRSRHDPNRKTISYICCVHTGFAISINVPLLSRP